MIRLFASTCLLLALILSGCAQQPQKVQPPLSKENLGNKEDWAKRQSQILAVKDWQASGKIGVKVPNDGGSASMRWEQLSSDYQIDLNGPLGMGKMVITGKPGEVTFSQAGKPPQTAKTPEELIRKNTGWTIPITQLAYWIRGLPAPTAKVTHYAFNDQGGLSRLEQAGWKISYGDYLQAEGDLALPGRITAEFNEVRLTLVIREWQLH